MTTAALMLHLFGPPNLRYFYLGEALLSCSVFVTSSFPLCPLSVILHPLPACEVDQFITGQRRAFTLSVLEPHPPRAALLMKEGTTSQPVQGDLRGQEVQFQKQLGEVITPPPDRWETPLQLVRAIHTLWTCPLGLVARPPSLGRLLNLDVVWPRMRVMQRGRLSVLWPW